MTEAVEHLKSQALSLAALSDKQQELLAELEGLPDECFPLLLQMIRTYRESVLLKPATDSFRRGWEDRSGPGVTGWGRNG